MVDSSVQRQGSGIKAIRHIGLLGLLRPMKRFLIASSLGLVLAAICSCSTVSQSGHFEIPRSVTPTHTFGADVCGGTTYAIKVKCREDDGTKVMLRITMKCSLVGTNQLFDAVDVYYGGKPTRVKTRRQFRQLRALLEGLASSEVFRRYSEENCDLLGVLHDELDSQRSRALTESHAAGKEYISETAKMRLAAQEDFVRDVHKRYALMAGHLTVPEAAEEMLRLLKTKGKRRQNARCKTQEASLVKTNSGAEWAEFATQMSNSVISAYEDDNSRPLATTTDSE